MRYTYSTFIHEPNFILVMWILPGFCSLFRDKFHFGVIQASLVYLFIESRLRASNRSRGEAVFVLALYRVIVNLSGLSREN
jgi:hypothetical protein